MIKENEKILLQKTREENKTMKGRKIKQLYDTAQKMVLGKYPFNRRYWFYFISLYIY